jgi:hypothetical protein
MLGAGAAALAGLLGLAFTAARVFLGGVAPALALLALGPDGLLLGLVAVLVKVAAALAQLLQEQVDLR